MLSLACTAIASTFGKLQPVTFEQVIHLALPFSQLVSFGFLGLSFFLTLTLYSQSERFAPSTYAIDLLHAATGPCVVLFLLASTWSLGTKPKQNNATPTAPGLRYGMMIPYRCVMVGFSLLYLAAVVIPLAAQLRPALQPLSFLSATVHIWLMMEQSVWSSLVHFLIHTSAVLIRGVLEYEDGGFRALIGVSFYPIILWALMRFRRLVRDSEDPNSAADCVASVFRAYFTAVLPAVLYFGSDSLGCALRKPRQLDWQEQNCAPRILGNYIGAIHAIAVVGLWIMMTNKQGGAGFDDLAAIRLELSRTELVVGFCVSCASLIALYLFATREAEGQDMDRHTVTKNVFLACWAIAFSSLALTMNRVHDKREKKRRDSMSGEEGAHAHKPHTTSRQPGLEMPTCGEVVVIPRTWSYLLMFISFVSYAVPQLFRVALQIDQLRGVTAAFANLIFMCHALMLSTTDNALARRTLVAHLGLILVGTAGAVIGDGRSTGFGLSLFLSYVITSVGYSLELVIWLCLIQPAMKRNESLNNALPITTFRLLFRDGCITMSLYCHFESIGVGFLESSEASAPWLTANTCVLTHFAFSMLLTNTIVADTGHTLNAALRGKAPWHIKVALGLSLSTSLLAMAMFAGREWSGERQVSVYSYAFIVFQLLWALVGGIVFVAHSSWAQNVKRTASSPTGRRESSAELAAVSSGQMLSTL